LVMCTKNSLKPCLREAVESVLASAPVSRIIVVDGGSTDGTVEFFSSYSNAEVVQIGFGNRAIQRQTAFSKAGTEVFISLDSDVIVPYDWFPRVRHQLLDNVGAITSAFDVIDIHGRNTRRALALMYGRDISISGTGGYPLGAVLFRKDAISGIRIPEELHVGEGEYVGRYIERKGYRFVLAADPKVYHNPHPRDDVAWESLVGGAMIRRYGFRSTSYMVKLWFQTMVESVWILVAGRDFHAMRTRLLVRAMMLAGFFTVGRKYNKSS